MIVPVQEMKTRAHSVENYFSHSELFEKLCLRIHHGFYLPKEPRDFDINKVYMGKVLENVYSYNVYSITVL